MSARNTTENKNTHTHIYTHTSQGCRISELKLPGSIQDAEHMNANNAKVKDAEHMSANNVTENKNKVNNTTEDNKQDKQHN